MKKVYYLYAILFVVSFFNSQAQDVLVIEMKDNTTRNINVEDIRQMTFQTAGIDPSCPVAEAIDLGLPSGTKWASWNVGASKPEEYGGYYAWGETDEKDYYDWSTYTHFDGSYSTCHHIGDDIAGTEYDVAHVKWGGSWRMPSLEQIEELINNCTRTWTTQNGVNGTLVTGPNGNSIFLPAVGNRWNDNLNNEGTYGNYWSSSLNPNYEDYAYSLNFNSSGWGWGYYYRRYGFSVRAVINAEKAQGDCPVAEAIDLGLPSGTKWASWNVGASKPEEYGGYYAWGETEEKDYYDWSTYTHCDGSYSTCHHIGDDIAGTEYDVAHVKWGGSWRMPTRAQQDELRENCTREWTQQNGVNGIRVTGPNGNSIFLPAAGYRWCDYLYLEGSNSDYWSSSLRPYGGNYAYDLDFGSSYWDWNYCNRDYGLSVRAVINAEKAQGDCPVAEAIDLGLPSGTKWASWNVGASKPEEYGGYYAWGETDEKDYYDWSTYTHCDGSYLTCHHIGDDIAGTEYDVAHVKWGGSWRMPTRAQQDELRENCTRQWMQQNGVNGIRVTGPNGNSIFLPAAGYRWSGNLVNEGSYGRYWSSSLSPYYEDGAYYLDFYSRSWGRYFNGRRSDGFSVRAVCP